MKLKKIAYRAIAIWSVLLLIFSFNLSLNVTAEFIVDNIDGVAFDDFNDNKSIFLINDCELSSGSIRLMNREFQTMFDQKSGKLKAWKFAEPIIVPGDEGILQFLSRLYNPENIISGGKEFNDTEYINIEGNDNLVVDTIAPRIPNGPSEWPLNIFRFDTKIERSIIKEVELSWNLGDYRNISDPETNPNLEEISMYVWSYGDYLPRWTHIKTLTYSESEIDKVDGWISSVRKNTDLFSEKGVLDMLIVGKPTDAEVNAKLTTNYASLDLTVKEGYVPTGNVTSTKIKPTNLISWERIIWSGSRPSANSDVTIQVLDSDGNIIEDLEGNTKGFTYSPIDLTSLSVEEYKELRLKATFNSDNIKFSPRLNSWGVLWQTSDGFFDSFSYDFRINESYGVKIEAGDIAISKFYSDWAIFGKNPDNSRSYVGQELKIGENETYWYTKEFSEYGGGFRSPVVKDGKVYISSTNRKIYAFNLTKNKLEDKQEPFDSSSSIVNFTVDCSLGVTDDYVIVPTSDQNSINQIYALNRSNLKEIVWDYGIDDFDDHICFSSSPNIDNERIFITGWSGSFANIPSLNYLFTKFHYFLANLGISLGVNHKLIGLDINGGELWNPISLPAASLCTPAVHNGLIYVGCLNYEGPSFFAYDENSGEEIWNATVGLVGRSSPVVGDGKVYIIGRDQSMFSAKGNDTLYALDAETGEEIWNKTIGNYSNRISNFIRSFKIDNLISLSYPISTPAYYDGTLFVLTVEGLLYALNGDDGVEKWSFDAASEASEGLFDFNILPYHTASPLVVDDIVYVATTQQGYIFALDNSKNGEIKWEYQIFDPEFDPSFPQTHYIFASPIMTDGLVLISENRPDVDDKIYRSRLQCIGKYKRNLRGKVVSVPIHVQKGRWWNRFNATIKNTEENNTIEFSILDENGKVIKSGLNGDDNDLSDINSNIIQLCAELIVNKEKELFPILEKWEIFWTIENKAPEFILNSFKAGAGQEGWINLIDLPGCSIRVKDIGVDKNISGIDADSAKYLLNYVKEGSNKVTSKWFDAVTDKESGAVETTITANIAEDLEGIGIKELKNISFKIKDLAGNENTSSVITFKLDNEKPSSNIKDAEDYKIKYNSVQLEAEGEDDKSGIANIALYYRTVDSSDWIKYGSEKSPYIWSFENDTSGEYEFSTRATDKAGNTEAFPSTADVDFIFDMNPPLKPDFNNYYTFDTLPEFSITFEDDYKLSSVEYKLSFHGANEWINISDSINDKKYIGRWTLQQNDWDRMFEDVEQTMFFRITDYCGNVYETPNDLEGLNLSKNIIPPVTADVTLVLTEFEEGGWDDSFTITADLPEDMEYEYIRLLYSYSSDEKDWSDWKMYGDELSEGPFTWDFEAEEGNGFYRFKTSIYNQGEIVQSHEKTVNVTIFPTALVSIMAFLILILFLFLIIVIRKMKKKEK